MEHRQLKAFDAHFDMCDAESKRKTCIDSMPISIYRDEF